MNLDKLTVHTERNTLLFVLFCPFKAQTEADFANAMANLKQTVTQTQHSYFKN